MILQKYTKKGLILFWLIMPLYTLLLNTLIFGNLLYSSLSLFVIAFVITLIVAGGLWLVHEHVTQLLNARLPQDADYVKKFALRTTCFLLVKSLVFYLLFNGYEALFDQPLPLFNYFVLLVVVNTFYVFAAMLQEGTAGLEKWKATLTDSEQLKRAYMQGQLWNLQSQLNPHFLFNNLNTLSSLIEDDAAAAETYLHEMKKVCRYLLLHNETPLVPLADELCFIRSYFHVLTARHGSALQVALPEGRLENNMMIPPLSLQALLESTLAQFELSKADPLRFEIKVEGGFLKVMNRMRKKVTAVNPSEAGKLQLLLKKFELVTRQPVVVQEDAQCRTIMLPLVQKG